MTHAPIRIRISPLIAADFERRNAFPELRPASARRIIGTSALYEITIDQACALHDDAQAMRRADDAPSGLRHAYCALWRQVSDRVDKERGVIHRGLEPLDRFHVGQLVKFNFGEDEPGDWSRANGEHAEVVSGRRWLDVTIVTVDGTDTGRREKCYVYLVMWRGGMINLEEHDLLPIYDGDQASTWEEFTKVTKLDVRQLRVSA